MSENESPSRKSVFDRLYPEYEEVKRKEDVQGYSERIWSLGRVADILWRHAPLSRSIVKSHVIRELDSGIDSDSMPLPISDRVLLMEYWWMIVKPMLESTDATGSEIYGELRFLEFVTPFKGPDGPEYISELFEEQISEKLAEDPYWEVISKACPSLASRISHLRSDLSGRGSLRRFHELRKPPVKAVLLHGNSITETHFIGATSS